MLVVYLLLLLPLPLRVHHAANCGGSYSSNGYTASGCPSVGSGSFSSYNCPFGFSGTPSGTVTCSDGSYSGTLSGCSGEWWGCKGVGVQNVWAKGSRTYEDPKSRIHNIWAKGVSGAGVRGGDVL